MASLVAERALDNMFIELMMVVGVFERRHGISGTDVAEVLNQKRREILVRVGHITPYKHAMEPWTPEDEEYLLSHYQDGLPLSKASKILGRSEAALRGKLDNLKFYVIINSYDKIVMEMAKAVVVGFENEYELDETWLTDKADEYESWLRDKADELWTEKAHKYLKEKVEKKREVA